MTILCYLIIVCGLPTCLLSYLYMSAFLPIPTYPCLPSYLSLPTHVYLPTFPYLPMSTFLPFPSYPSLPTHVYLPSYPCLPTYISLPSNQMSTYLPILIHLHLYIIATDPGGGIGLVSVVKLSLIKCLRYKVK